MDSRNLYGIKFRLPAYAAQDLGFSLLHLLLQADGHCGRNDPGRGFLIQAPENSFLRIGFYGSDPVAFIIINHAGQFSRRTVFSLRDGNDFRLIQASALQIHQCGRIHIVDSVSQRAKAVVLIQPGQGADPLRVVANPDSQLVFSVLILLRSQAHIKLLPIPEDGQDHFLSPAVRNALHERRLSRHRLSVRLQDIISLLQQSGRRSICLSVRPFKLSGGNHKHAFRLHIDPDGDSGRNKRPVVDHLHLDRFKGNQPKQLQLHVIAFQLFRIQGERLIQVDRQAFLRNPVHDVHSGSCHHFLRILLSIFRITARPIPGIFPRRVCGIPFLRIVSIQLP